MILSPFKGKTIVVTGGSRGIGLEMARLFARNGANLALIARGKDDLNAAREALESEGGGISVRAYACDVTNAELLGDYFHMIRLELGAIDGIVANSGYCHPGNFHEIDLGDFDRQIDTNLRGAVYTLRLGLPHMLENPNGGFLALTSSPAGHMGIFGFGAYGPTKAALSNLSETLRIEYGDRNIRVHLLLPPDTDTPGYREEVDLYPPETRAILQGGSLLGSEYVAAKFVNGIAKRKRVIGVGFEARAMMFAMRFMPRIWDIYSAGKMRKARKNVPPPDAVTSPEPSEDSSESTRAAS
jgi:3-dehydrosphinganine reductase